MNIENLKHYFSFLWVFVEKEFKVRYKRAIFGFLWVILNPLLQMLIMGAIFSIFIKIPDYFLFLFTGLLPWSFFVLALSKAVSSFVNAESLIQKAKFPKEIIPLSIIFSDFIHLITSWVLFLVFLVITSRFYLPGIFLLILGIIWLLVFTIGLSMIMATLQVKYRDISFFVKSILILWFYATPILYDLTMIPKKLYIVFSFNPLTSVFEIFHLAVLNKGVLIDEILIINFLLTLLIVVFGVVIFARENKYFVDWL